MLVSPMYLIECGCLYHNPRFQPAPRALEVGGLMSGQLPSEAVPESTDCGELSRGAAPLRPLLLLCAKHFSQTRTSYEQPIQVAQRYVTVASSRAAREWKIEHKWRGVP